MREKTGIEVLGRRLFATPHLVYKVLQRLPRNVEERMRELRVSQPDLEPDVLQALLIEEFAIEPLVICPVSAIRVELIRRDFWNEYNSLMSAHLHEAEVPYQGSKFYWRNKMVEPDTFGYHGKIGPSVVRIRQYIDVEDYDGFKRGIEKALGEVRSTLAQSRIIHEEQAEEARAIIECTVANDM